jgi:hypothetical protein
MATRLNLHVLPRRAADYTTAPAKCFGPMLTHNDIIDIIERRGWRLSGTRDT